MARTGQIESVAREGRSIRSGVIERFIEHRRPAANAQEAMMGCIWSRKRRRNGIWDRYRNPNGKRVVKTIGPLKAFAALGKVPAAIREDRYFDKRSGTATMDELVRRLMWAKTKESFESYKVYAAPAAEYFKGRVLSTITEHDVEKFRASRIGTSTMFKRDRTASTINHELSVLKGMVSKAVAWGMAERNVAERVKKLPEPKGRVRFLTIEEAGRLLKASSRHLYPIVLTALETGMRRGEILNLRWADVDFRSGTIFVRKSKIGASRHVPMSNRLRAP
jgi:integrase